MGNTAQNETNNSGAQKSQSPQNTGLGKVEKIGLAITLLVFAAIALYQTYFCATCYGDPG